ncbi:MAG: hypothetical protein QOI48_777 [Solirubrobacteraceae bacterium]|nr:hypothetical protein [Solirubrobacteraceae bacterium]
MRRRTDHRISERCGLLSIGVLLAVLCCTGQAFADSATISVATAAGASDPLAGAPRVFTISGTSAGSNSVYVKYRATGGAPCAGSADTDSGTLGANDPFHVYGDPVNGAFNLQRAGTWSRGAGTFLFCTWIASSSSANTTPFAQTIAFRAPSGTITATLSPTSPAVDQQATVTITGSSESPAYVYATIRPAGEPPCAPTYGADTGTGLIDGEAVNGSFSVLTSTKQATGGSYLICLWLAASPVDSAPIAGPQPQSFQVVGPIAAPLSIERVGGKISLHRRGGRYRGRLTTPVRCRFRRTVLLRRIGSAERSFGRTLTRKNGTFTFNRRRRLRGSLYVVATPRTQGWTVCSVVRWGVIRG